MTALTEGTVRDLIRLYDRRANWKRHRLTPRRRQESAEIAQALKELLERRKAESIPILGTVS